MQALRHCSRTWPGILYLRGLGILVFACDEQREVSARRQLERPRAYSHSRKAACILSCRPY
jgi:hypothetical protein